jgi:hypothetical protein
MTLPAYCRDGDEITLCQAARRRLTKTINRDGTVAPCDDARLFNLTAVPLADLDDLHRMLLVLSRRSDCAIVRGAIADPGRTAKVRRLANADAATGDLPTLRDVPHRWIALDLDGVSLPAGTDPRDLRACHAAALRELPAAFHGAAVIIQATASHCIKPGARLRVWCWLDRPLSNREAKCWLRGTAVDLSLFSPAQLHFVAAPALAPGAIDPVPDRWLRLPGSPAVVTPSLAALAPPPRPTPSAAPPTSARKALGRLAGLIRVVAQAPEGERHRRMFWAGCRAGALVADGWMSPSAATAALLEAVKATSYDDMAEAERTIGDAIGRGMQEGGHRV